MPEAAAHVAAALRAARHARRAARAFVTLTVLTVGLVMLGALVRAHGAGLACPDWPRCCGVWLPAHDLRVGFEWTHRLVVGAISTLFLTAGAFVAWVPALRKVALRPLGAAVLLLVVQIVLGGLTVLLALASWTV